MSTNTPSCDTTL